MILFHNDCHPLPLSCRNYDLEQKGIGMYYEMPTTKNFERHFRRRGRHPKFNLNWQPPFEPAAARKLAARLAAAQLAHIAPIVIGNRQRIRP